MNFSSIGQKLHRPDAGLLVLRVGFGVLILLAGVLKLFGGEPMFKQVGEAMAIFGITWQPVLWGLLASLAETLGGLLLILGLFFRPAAFVLFVTMLVAMTVMWMGGPSFESLDAFSKWLGGFSPPFVHGAAFLALLLTGPGKFALQKSGGGGSAGQSASKSSSK